MISCKDLCILKLTGILEIHNKKEFIIPEEMMKNCVGAFFTCEFLNDSKHIIRSYYKNGNKWWETEYKNGLKHGKSIWWCENGNKRWKEEYQKGQLHGKYIGWYYNGEIEWEEEYENGKLIRKIK